MGGDRSHPAPLGSREDHDGVEQVQPVQLGGAGHPLLGTYHINAVVCKLGGSGESRIGSLISTGYSPFELSAEELLKSPPY